MKRVQKDRVIEQLNLRSFGQKGWMRSSSCECPECHRSDKFGIKFSEYSGTVHCFHDDFSESLIKYLERLGREDLLDKDGSVSIKFGIRSLENKKEEDIELVEKELPIGFKRVHDDKYLNDRNFIPRHYNLFQPGYSDDPLLNNYIIYQIFQFGRRVGWQARSKYSKEWHKENLKKYKEKKCRLVLRYKDAPGMDTSRILGGCDDITPFTDTLILVEGIFDKTGVDNKLDLYETDDIRCCFTFGNKLSQISIIRSFKSIKNIYLLYDFGTMKQVKTMALELSKYYNVRANIMPSIEDPGDASDEVIFQTLENSKTAIEFFVGRIENHIF
jgi:hypothetical protein